MKKKYIITVITSILMVVLIAGIQKIILEKKESRFVRVGALYVGDSSNTYTGNFIKAQKAIEKKFGNQVEFIPMFNVLEGNCENSLQILVDKKCDIIFTTSYGYGDMAKEFAKKYPNIQFCHATGDNANIESFVPNYHTFMGRIYEGRYTAGVVAGLKLQELIDKGQIKKEDALIGYVGAFPYAEVISGFTAFFLGVQSVVPSSKMIVKYTNSWTDFVKEKNCTKELIDQGCIVISQHSDTAGPATACEETDSTKNVFLVSYNQSMADVAPTTYLIGSKINWTPYMVGAVEAVLNNKSIEKNVDAVFFKNDACAGFDKNWVEILELNTIVAADGTKENIEKIKKQISKGEIDVFKGDFIGVNPENPLDTINLNVPYKENSFSSAPSFSYILKDKIIVQ